MIRAASFFPLPGPVGGLDKSGQLAAPKADEDLNMQKAHKTRRFFPISDFVMGVGATIWSVLIIGILKCDYSTEGRGWVP
jgi:hypothetical protein